MANAAKSGTARAPKTASKAAKKGPGAGQKSVQKKAAACSSELHHLNRPSLLTRS